MQNLKVENIKLKEILGKDHWSFKGHYDADNTQNVDIGGTDYHGISYGIQSCYKGSGIVFEDLMLCKDAWHGEGKREAELFNFWRSGSKATTSIDSFPHCIVSKSLEMNDDLNQRRDVALSRSLFSAMLSLLIGIIIWEAGDPCMPLVVALLPVVGISLKSVVQFFSTIINKPASDAVALLSFNWFILGTLTYPMLPRVVRIFAPLTTNFGLWGFSISSIINLL